MFSAETYNLRSEYPEDVHVQRFSKSSSSFNPRSVVIFFKRFLVFAALIAAVVLVAVRVMATNGSGDAIAVAGRISIGNAKNKISLNLPSKKLRFIANGAELSLAALIGQTVSDNFELVSSDDKRVVVHWPSSRSNLTVELNDQLSNGGGGMSVFDVHWRSNDLFSLTDSLFFGAGHWFGGCEIFNVIRGLQVKWPLEKNRFPMAPYVPSDLFKAQYGGVIERYWLSSERIAITVDNDVPLWFALNENGSQQMTLRAQYKDSIYQNFVDITEVKPELKYKLWLGGSSLKDLHLSVINKYLGRPTGIPDERMLIQPIWSTWAKYHQGIDQKKVLQFAKEINFHGFNNSHIEIDDVWSTHYGDLVFDPAKFPAPAEMTKQLRSMGFRVSIWIHPFANFDSETWKKFEGNCELWVCQASGLIAGIHWWDGYGASLDPTSSKAADWFVDRLREFAITYGIDSYKFDAGEVSWLPDCFHLANASYPFIFSKRYAEMASRLGRMIEVRVGTGSQSLPNFVRILDKDSTWGYNNGLRSLVINLLTFGLLGYPFVLPDMLGGNAYSANQDLSVKLYPDKELYLRWTAANVFMPSIQISIAPWDYADANVTLAVKKLLSLRNEIANELIKLAHNATTSGEPIVRPLWWLEESESALTCDDEFLVGNDILVAPILDQGLTARHVYLPTGSWLCQLSRETYHGPTDINVTVNFDEIIWFRRIS